MSGLLFPGNEDFFLAQGRGNSQMLCTKINGPVLVLFYSTQCIYCKKLIPIFKKLTSIGLQTNFAMVNIGKTKDVIAMSGKTSKPITYVPLIIYYINNKPYIMYKGAPDFETIKRFIIEVSNDIQSKINFSQRGPQGVQQQVNFQEDISPDIPEYSVGHPLYGEDDDMKCYLNWDEAYDGELKPGQKGDIRYHKHYKSQKKSYGDTTYEKYNRQVQRQAVNPYAARGRGGPGRGPPQPPPPQQVFTPQDHRSMYSHPSQPISTGAKKPGSGYQTHRGQYLRR